jgi:hypothetical protein
MELFILLAQQQQPGILGGALRGALIGGAIGVVVALVFGVIKLFKPSGPK